MVVDARLGFSMRPSTRRLKSILMRRANSEYVCMYVCLTLLSVYVCMSHSELQNQRVSEGVKFLIKTLQNLTFN